MFDYKKNINETIEKFVKHCENNFDHSLSGIINDAIFDKSKTKLELYSNNQIKIFDISGSSGYRGIILYTEGIKSYTLVNVDGDDDLHAGWTTDTSYPSKVDSDPQNSDFAFKDYAVVESDLNPHYVLTDSGGRPSQTNGRFYSWNSAGSTFQTKHIDDTLHFQGHSFTTSVLGLLPNKNIYPLILPYTKSYQLIKDIQFDEKMIEKFCRHDSLNELFGSLVPKN